MLLGQSESIGELPDGSFMSNRDTDRLLAGLGVFSTKSASPVLVPRGQTPPRLVTRCWLEQLRLPEATVLTDSAAVGERFAMAFINPCVGT